MSQEDIKRAKDILENASITDSPFGETCGEIMEYIESLEERIAIMSESGLLPISEKKPPYDKDVLLYLKSGEYFVGHRENHYGQDVYCDGELGGGYVHPTHWMYLPKPPKGEET